MSLFWLTVNGLGGIGPSLIVFLLVVILPTCLGLFILGPISRAAGRLQAPTRFQLSDILWLLVHFQFVIWYCVQYVGTRHLPFFVMALVTLTLAAIATWGGAVSFASRAGVTDARRRITFVLVHLPATLMLMILAPFALLTFYLLHSHWLTQDFRAQFEYLVSLVGLTQFQAAVAAASVPFLAYALRRVALWILNVGPALKLKPS